MKHRYPSFFVAWKVLLVGMVLLSTPLAVYAGCGCSKPPPLPAAIRPDATYAGSTVTLFHSDLQNGRSYRVVFTSGMTGQSNTVDTTALTRRDLADGQYKVQLNVPVPSLPLGPTSITIQTDVGGGIVTVLDDSAFTVAPTPVTVPAQPGDYRYQNFQAAVGRDGAVYLSLDMTQVQLPLVVQAQAKGYPLRFGNTDVVFYNTQGFLMQTLAQGIPGLFTIQTAANSADSDTLRYSRHEFATYYVQHAERQVHQLDPTDSDWHQDGTYHVDHNHLVLALAGRLSNGVLPSPGATPAFELVLQTYSIFHQGLVGSSSVSTGSQSRVDSFNSQTGLSSNEGDIFSNGLVTLSDYTQIFGDVTGSKISVGSTAKLNGAKLPLSHPAAFLPVAIPKALPNIGMIYLANGLTQTITGPGSFVVSSITITSGQLIIDNTRGPVTLYVTGPINIAGTSSLLVKDPNPEKFAVYVSTADTVKLAGQSNYYGVFYAPASLIQLSGKAQYFGAYVGKQVQVTGQAKLHYDTALRGQR